jgi:hypothetical protein
MAVPLVGVVLQAFYFLPGGSRVLTVTWNTSMLENVPAIVFIIAEQTTRKTEENT